MLAGLELVECVWLELKVCNPIADFAVPELSEKAESDKEVLDNVRLLMLEVDPLFEVGND